MSTRSSRDPIEDRKLLKLHKQSRQQGWAIVRRIPFVKYTCYGNNFVIIDQVSDCSLSEDEMSFFARAATDTAFGIGCDNLLVVQQCNENVLKGIYRARDYWTRCPDPNQADVIFRMFEPAGEEALCCGNGLACIADYLAQRHDLTNVSILTEVPLQRPGTLNIGSINDGHTSWVDLGTPRRVPPELVTPGSRSWAPSFITNSSMRSIELV